MAERPKIPSPHPHPPNHLPSNPQDSPAHFSKLIMEN